MILNLAEAAAEAGKPADAVKASEWRSAPVPVCPHCLHHCPKPTSSNAIRAERRVELAMEENRYFDLRRWSKPTDDLASDRPLGDGYGNYPECGRLLLVRPQNRTGDRAEKLHEQVPMGAHSVE